jgi:hypothetical protein
MLSREENELLTLVHAGTPMGRLFRRYWIPTFVGGHFSKIKVVKREKPEGCPGMLQYS